MNKHTCEAGKRFFKVRLALIVGVAVMVLMVNQSNSAQAQSTTGDSALCTCPDFFKSRMPFFQKHGRFNHFHQIDTCPFPLQKAGSPIPFTAVK